ncbi:hypothetical protein [Flavobacterium sp.]|uniref:hypothetical protein n=1 Tax=Flavobacterium sp. TaxID=239 RepID=UPI0038FCC94A
MEKKKLLTITIIGLLLLNLGTLGFLFLHRTKGHRPPHEDRTKPKEIIIRQLNFDVVQQRDYAKLIEWHRREITRLDSNIRQTKNKLYSQLNQTEVNVKAKDSLIILLNSYQKQVEETHFQHFEDIKKLCNKEQMEDFSELTEELSRVFLPKPHGPKND